MAERPSPDPAGVSAPNGDDLAPAKATDDLTWALAAVLEMSLEASPDPGSAPRAPESAPDSSEPPRFPGPDSGSQPPWSPQPPAGPLPPDLDLDLDAVDPAWAPEAPPPAPDAPTEWAPAASARREVPVVAGDEAPDEAGGADDGWSWWEAEPDEGQERAPSAEPDRSAAALQEAGFGGPLHSALGELGRIIPDPGVEAALATKKTQAPVAAGLGEKSEAHPRSRDRRPDWLSAAGLRQVWADHRRDWGPGLIVAALILVAFVVVLSAGSNDRPMRRVDTGSGSTSVPTTTASAPTTLFEDVLPPEVPVEPDAAAAADGSGTPSGPSATPRRRGSARAPVTSPPATQARPRSGAAPAPAPADPPADPPADDPPDDPSPPSQTTVPTTSVPTPPPPGTDDPCASLPEPQRSRCHGARDR